MILEPVNLTTGPVSISAEVRNSFCALPISHRSAEFRKLFDSTRELLRERFCSREIYLMSGSGTLANEAMLHQIKSTRQKGLVLSNGEFGGRLVSQARRISLNFDMYEVGWGKAFDEENIRSYLASGEIKWLLFCHCETSTGMVNNLRSIAALCAAYHCLCFVDCISSVGNVPIDLSGVSMATASSGKGLAAYAGLAILFSNIGPAAGNDIPSYLDIAQYAEKNHIPFTISSNLVSALYTSLIQKNKECPPALIDEYSGKYFGMLNEYSLVPFGNESSKVFTITLPQEKNHLFLRHMENSKIVLSYESEYLKTRSWSQLAVFGYFRESQLSHAATVLENSLKAIF